ncbi:ABC transporter ATP-binding protein [Bifidobacterium olomucense]|uniref:ABC transporter ATP-binding protein n=1 Tax=Bifidobacterium olomucense TaxID=2675324 RepID=A0A7Y0EVH1_9BIFI|nr:ABC transporter ATP-binding protein [Bifidobacterium sp. DSM 109959]NMM97190.1 ABC transporter ATP-binding protein [Bifidobacterium sp. DSM 109959]
MNDRMPIIRLSNVSANVRLPNGDKLTTVRNASVEFEKGTSTAIVGKSGSGKTSIASIIGLLNAQFSGTLEFNGESVDGWSDARRTKFRCAHIGFVFQNYSLIPHLRVIENVALPLEYSRKYTKRKMHRRISNALQSVGLSDRASAFPSSLSGGEQQRVAIARALVTGPDIIICDEPTGALDTETGNAVADLLFDRVNQDHTTLILVTHDPQLASKCQRQIIMERGELHAQNDH